MTARQPTGVPSVTGTVPQPGAIGEDDRDAPRPLRAPAARRIDACWMAQELCTRRRRVLHPRAEGRAARSLAGRHAAIGGRLRDHCAVRRLHDAQPVGHALAGPYGRVPGRASRPRRCGKAAVSLLQAGTPSSSSSPRIVPQVGPASTWRISTSIRSISTPGLSDARTRECSAAPAFAARDRSCHLNKLLRARCAVVRSLRWHGQVRGQAPTGGGRRVELRRISRERERITGEDRLAPYSLDTSIASRSSRTLNRTGVLFCTLGQGAPRRRVLIP